MVQKKVKGDYSFYEKLDAGELPEDFVAVYGEEFAVGCLRDVFDNAVLPFMVASRFRYRNISAVIKSVNICRLVNDSKTPLELLELFLFEKVNRNKVLNLDFESTVTSTEFGPFIDAKMTHLYDKVKSGNYSWWTSNIFDQLAALTSDYDRKKRAGISTPYALVSKLIDNIGNLTATQYFLDPCCGRGIFLYEIKQRLISKGETEKDCLAKLSGWDIDLRKSYIAEALIDPNMVSEQPCISLHDSIEVTLLRKFDVVIGNPPFQSQTEGDASLWPQFIQKGFELLKDEGFMALILPGKFALPGPNIRKGRINCWDKFIRPFAVKHVNLGECSKFFPKIGRTPDYFGFFVMQKVANSAETEVVTNEATFKLDLSGMKFLPRRGNKCTFEIFKKVQDWRDVNGCCMFQRGERIRAVTTPKIGFRKMQWAAYEASLVYDLEGTADFRNTLAEFGWLEIPKKSTKEILDSVFLSKLFRFMGFSCNDGTFNQGFQRSLPMLDLNKVWTDLEIYHVFQFTQLEIAHIEATIRS
jgi:SAM-dependent methyltransferase